MKHSRILRMAAAIAVLCAAVPAVRAAVPPTAGSPEYPAMGQDIFDRRVEAETVLAGAVQEARGSHRRILLLLGANWCPYCRRLHAIIGADAVVRAALSEGYVFRYVDANWRTDRNRNRPFLERLGDPIRRLGLPSLVLLDSEGRKLQVQGTQALAAPTDAEVSQRLVALLRAWRN